MTMERTVSRMIMTTVIQMVIQMERIPYGTLPRRVLLPVSMAKVEQEVRKEHQLPDLFPIRHLQKPAIPVANVLFKSVSIRESSAAS